MKEVCTVDYDLGVQYKIGQWAIDFTAPDSFKYPSKEVSCFPMSDVLSVHDCFYTREHTIDCTAMTAMRCTDVAGKMRYHGQGDFGVK